MHAPGSSWTLLVLAAGGALATVTALVRVRSRRTVPLLLSWLLSWFSSELALFQILASALVVAGFALAGALTAAPGRWAAGIVVLCWGGLVFAQWRARSTPQVLEQALVAGLGAGYRERIPADRRALLTERITFAQLARPFALRGPGVEWLRDIAYADGHERHVLDIYRPAAGTTNAPVLLQIHGGGWTLGSKREQALPLIHYLAARGWVVVAINYRLSPRERFPAHLLDCKRALAWIRGNIARHGGDPSFIAVTGGSAGGHLASLLGLTANERALQPGFEDVDTRVAACVPFYGIYDFPDRHGLRNDGGAMALWLEKTVMGTSPAGDPATWDLASPLVQIRPDAPPFFVLHGTIDVLAAVEEARLFVERLLEVSRAPVVYAELSGAQHAWDMFVSVRALHTVHAVARFLEWAYATRGKRR